jgi:osmotically inducible protein OsmC
MTDRHASAHWEGDGKTGKGKITTQSGVLSDNPYGFNTKAVVTLVQDGDGFKVTKSALTLKAVIPGIDEAKFDELAGNAEKGCPISKLLNAEITLDKTLVQS